MASTSQQDRRDSAFLSLASTSHAAWKQPEEPRTTPRDKEPVSTIEPVLKQNRSSSASSSDTSSSASSGSPRFLRLSHAEVEE